MHNVILECFSAKYFSSPGNCIRFYTPLRNGNSEANQISARVLDDKIAKAIKCLCFWRMFSLLWISPRENFHTSVFSREIFRISLVVELGLNEFIGEVILKIDVI
jgi:hypothetical protein